ELNSSADVSKALLSLKVSNSSSAAGIIDAMLFASGVGEACYGNKQCNIYDNSWVYVIIGASLNQVNINLFETVLGSTIEDDGAVTISWNTNNQLLK
uniref:Uncharacterized protein n=1 Tax=Acrobeloides nanus TaxID=290746 RepID=A0A914C7H3_9BILA